MINVMISKNKDLKPYKFEVSGHAGYDVAGKDIVCSAVSVLMMVIGNSMQSNCEDTVNISINERKAQIIIDLPTVKSNTESRELLVLANTLLQGLTEVNREYKNKYISVKEEVDND